MKKLNNEMEIVQEIFIHKKWVSSVRGESQSILPAITSLFSDKFYTFMFNFILERRLCKIKNNTIIKRFF